MQSMGLEKENKKDNGTYFIGEQGDLGGFFEKLNENDQKTYDQQVLNENKDNSRNK